jgi:acyl-CoA thioester hydrolase
MAYRYEHTRRIRYRECDPMGVVYHTHYLDFFEEARTEALRGLGVAYRELEEAGIIMPVVEAHVEYKRPAQYDDLIVVEACFEAMPAVRVPITYTVRPDGDDTVLATGKTDLCFVDAETRSLTRPPENVRAAFRTVFDDPEDAVAS